MIYTLSNMLKINKHYAVLASASTSNSNQWNSYGKDSTMILVTLAVLVTKGVIVNWDQLLVSHPSYSYA